MRLLYCVIYMRVRLSGEDSAIVSVRHITRNASVIPQILRIVFSFANYVGKCPKYFYSLRCFLSRMEPCGLNKFTSTRG